MAAVIHLVTVVDIDDRPVPGGGFDASVADGPVPDGVGPGLAPLGPPPSEQDPRHMSFSALHLAVLDDSRRLTLLDDRGWGASGPPDIWDRTSVEDIEAEARMVVGPDGPYGDRSEADMAGEHWAALAGFLRRQGVLADPQELSRLPHKVELSERLRTRLPAS